MKKTIKILFIVSVLLSVLFISLYFILNYQAAVCDPVWEVKRHDALIYAANNFLYAFFSTFAIAVAMGGALFLKYRNNKIKVNENKISDETKKYDNIEKIMAEKDVSFFEAVWQYFLSVKAIERFKEAYISQLQGLNIDEQIAEAKMTLTDRQKETVKSELNKKINGIKNGEYDRVFESVFKDEVELEIKMSDNNAVGGMSPDEYLNLLFDSSDGAMFFFDFSLRIENDIPIIKLDIDDGSIEWQPFD